MGVEVTMNPIRQCKRWKECPLCRAGVLGIINHTAELHKRRKELQEKGNGQMPLKKPDVTASDGGVPKRTREGDEWVLYPTLMEYLAEDRYEDGSARRTATLLIFFDQGDWKGCLNDRDTDRVAFVTATCPTALLAVLEDKLTSSSIEWRASQGGSRKRK